MKRARTRPLPRPPAGADATTGAEHPRHLLSWLLEWHGPGGPAGLQNRPGVATPRLLGSTPGPLRQPKRRLHAAFLSFRPDPAAGARTGTARRRSAIGEAAEGRTLPPRITSPRGHASKTRSIDQLARGLGAERPYRVLSTM